VKQFLEFPLPPTLNETLGLAKSHWSVYREKKEEWSATARLCAQSARSHQFTGKVWTSWWWFVKSRANDPDNLTSAAKYILDGLQDGAHPVIKNDNLTIVQQPWIHWFPIQEGREDWFPVQRETKGDNGVILLLSDEPIFTVFPKIGFALELAVQGFVNIQGVKA
jgi:hypothetical protein